MGYNFNRGMKKVVSCSVVLEGQRDGVKVCDLLEGKRKFGHEIWTKYEQYRKRPENAYCQNSQTNTCKNESWNPWFVRDSGRERRNERSPIRALIC